MSGRLFCGVRVAPAGRLAAGATPSRSGNACQLLFGFFDSRVRVALPVFGCDVLAGFGRAVFAAVFAGFAHGVHLLSIVLCGLCLPQHKPNSNHYITDTNLYVATTYRGERL